MWFELHSIYAFYYLCFGFMQGTGSLDWLICDSDYTFHAIWMFCMYVCAKKKFYFIRVIYFRKQATLNDFWYTFYIFGSKNVHCLLSVVLFKPFSFLSVNAVLRDWLELVLKSALMQNSKLLGFLLKWLDFHHKCDCTFVFFAGTKFPFKKSTTLHYFPTVCNEIGLVKGLNNIFNRI